MPLIDYIKKVVSIYESSRVDRRECAIEEILVAIVDGKDVFAFPGCGTKLKNGKPRKACSCEYVRRFWEKLLLYVDGGDVSAAIWIGFNCSQLQTLQQCEASPLNFLTCFIDHRVPYLDENLEKLSSPPHNSYVTLVAPPGSPYEALFKSSYEPLGIVTRKA